MGNKTLYIPLVNNETEELASCREFRDPSDHGAGTQACSGGYEFSFQGENEMTITAEVSRVTSRLTVDTDKNIKKGELSLDFALPFWNLDSGL